MSWARTLASRCAPSAATRCAASSCCSAWPSASPRWSPWRRSARQRGRRRMRQFKRMVGTFDTHQHPARRRRSTRGMPSLTSVEPTLRFEDAQAIAAEIPDVRRVAREQSAFDIDVQLPRPHTTSIWSASRPNGWRSGATTSPWGAGSATRTCGRWPASSVIGEDVRGTCSRRGSGRQGHAHRRGAVQGDRRARVARRRPGRREPRQHAR